MWSSFPNDDGSNLRQDSPAIGSRLPRAGEAEGRPHRGRATKEIGVRLALGASGSRIIRAVLGQYLIPVSVGLLAGIVIATPASILLLAMQGKIPHFEPIGYAAGLLGFLVIAFSAALLPCRKALKIEPASVLRCD
jgi:ABC-type antimicrobial peptide transport system permease subunit